ncbi:MAG TPA: SDR family oxidoreductase [Casimicrobiaceae bacterium]|nr:SDR family oxidoreductase [Casimicrobiaceae bacterium]
MTKASKHRLPELRVAITGGTSGLGLALVELLSSHGARVAFCARVARRVAEVERDHPGTHGIVADVSDKQAIHPLAMRFVAALDGLDVLINNVSSLGPVPLATLADTECEDLKRAFETNVMAPFRLTRALLGALAASSRERGVAAVVNISSDAAVSPYPNWGAYGASKAALAHLTRIWHAELVGEGIRFLSIDPGDMDTPLHALAVPDADPATLRRPDDAAAEIVERLLEILYVTSSLPEPA